MARSIRSRAVGEGIAHGCTANCYATQEGMLADIEQIPVIQIVWEIVTRQLRAYTPVLRTEVNELKHIQGIGTRF